MGKPKKGTLRTATMVVLLIIAAVISRFVSKYTDGFISYLFSYLRSFLYIGLFAVWGCSIYRRIIQMQVQRCLVGVSVLMVFWLTVRTIKYLLATDPVQLRYLWYFYYVGMQFNGQVMTMDTA